MIDVLCSVMVKAVEVASLVLVGALWGCTNPYLRKGSVEAASIAPSNASSPSDPPKTTLQCVRSSLSKFLHFSVWLPYLFNQAGSVLYYFTLSQSDLSLAVPICNALSLVFSIATSYALGERSDHPWRTAAGSALVVSGVAICLYSREEHDGKSP